MEQKIEKQVWVINFVPLSQFQKIYLFLYIQILKRKMKGLGPHAAEIASEYGLAIREAGPTITAPRNMDTIYLIHARGASTSLGIF